MAEGLVRVEVEGPVAVLTVSRPERLNALDLGMLEQLAAACDAAEAESGVRAAVLTGEGRAFSAGGDIKAWSAMSASSFGHGWVRLGHRVFDRLAGLRVPLVAALNGHALGGGLELAGTADFRIAEAQVRIGLPETGLGMIPGWSGTQRLVRRFGAQAVRRMALGGEVFSAAQAQALGIVDRVVETGGALAAAKAYALGIAERGPAAVAAAKLMIAAAEGGEGGSAVEALASMLVAQTDDLKEGVAAFTEKRKARFSGDF